MVEKDEPVIGTEYTRWIYRTWPVGGDGINPADPDYGVPVNIGDATIENDGNIKSLRVNDNDSQVLLNQILMELKKLNIHLSIMNDKYIKNEDVE